MGINRKLKTIGKLAEEASKLSIDEFAQRIAWEFGTALQKIEDNLQDEVESKAKP